MMGSIQQLVNKLIGSGQAAVLANGDPRRGICLPEGRRMDVLSRR